MLIIVAVPSLLAEPPQKARGSDNAVTFYGQVLPLLQKRCLSCHLSGSNGSTGLATYDDVLPRVEAIRDAVKHRRMPPWFADPNYGLFANDPRLPGEEIALIDTWVSSGTNPGKKPKQRAIETVTSYSEVSADLVVTAQAPVPIPANNTANYQYLVFALPFTYDRWVSAAEIRPSAPGVVHHAVLYVREQQSKWLRKAVAGVPYIPSEGDALHEALSTTAEIMAIYTPGAPAMIWPAGTGKKLPAGADLVLQIHYTSQNTPAQDQPQIGLAILADRPAKRILTLQMILDDPRIAGRPAYKASVSGSLPADALLISLLPHTHLQGIECAAEIVAPDGGAETLLKVQPNRINWPPDFSWQSNYVLKTPRLLRKGTVLRWTATSNSPATKPDTRDPAAEVRRDDPGKENVIGFFDVAVDAAWDNRTFFAR